MNRWKPSTYLYAGGGVGLVLFIAGVAFGVLAESNVALVAGVACQALGAALLFPIAVSVVYDRLRERWLGDTVWRIFGELADAGISRVYRDREARPDSDNAEARLREEFRAHEDDVVRMVGVSLRVFFNPLGPFYGDIETLLKKGGDRISLCALVSDPTSPEALERASIEEPGRDGEVASQIVRDIESTVATVRRLFNERGPRLQLREYRQAPYCTAILFPHIAYFSPNILAPAAPVRLPMILFRRGSHGYRMLELSFEYLWAHARQVVPPDGA